MGGASHEVPPFSLCSARYGGGMRRTIPLLALCLIAACNSGPNAAASDVTPSEARALDEAAEMIEARRLPAAQPSTVPAK